MLTPNGYREHRQGEVFEAVLPASSEELAVLVGAVEVVERSTPGLREGSYRLPGGWAEKRAERGDSPAERSR